MKSSELARRAQAAAQGLAQPQPMRRGSISERTICCHKASCACATDPERRHGPYISLVQGGGAKTKSRWISKAEESLVRQQIVEGQAFRDRIDGLFKVCEEWADAELESARADSPEAVEKKGFKKSFRKKSQTRSKD